jgi:hypothetical protein
MISSGAERALRAAFPEESIHVSGNIDAGGVHGCMKRGQIPYLLKPLDMSPDIRAGGRQLHGSRTQAVLQIGAAWPLSARLVTAPAGPLGP